MRRQRWYAWLALTGVAVSGSDSKSLLTNLPQEYAAAKWSTYQKDSKDFHVFTKELAGAEDNGISRPAVVKVVARARLPVRALLETFLSEDAQVLRPPRALTCNHAPISLCLPPTSDRPLLA